MVADELFFELIRVAIGNQNVLSFAPSSDDWRDLYALAKKQSLVGICFAAFNDLSVYIRQVFQTFRKHCSYSGWEWRLRFSNEMS